MLSGFLSSSSNKSAWQAEVRWHQQAKFFPRKSPKLSNRDRRSYSILTLRCAELRDSSAMLMFPVNQRRCRSTAVARPYTSTGNGLPHRDGRATRTLFSGMRQPLVRRGWRRSTTSGRALVRAFPPRSVTVWWHSGASATHLYSSPVGKGCLYSQSPAGRSVRGQDVRGLWPWGHFRRRRITRVTL